MFILSYLSASGAGGGPHLIYILAPKPARYIVIQGVWLHIITQVVMIVVCQNQV